MPFQPGQSGNPAGRQAGSHNKVTNELVDGLLDAYRELGGKEYLIALSKRSPRAFVALLSRILPRESTIHADVLHAWEAAVGRSQEAEIRQDERVKSKN